MNGPVKKHKFSLGVGWLEGWITFAGLLVVAGLVVESGPELCQAVMTRTWPPRMVTGSTVITIGVFVEAALGFFAAREAKRTEREANERIALEEKATAEANLARAKIEQQLAWRTITDEQREALVQELSRFAGQHVVISMWPETAETGWFRHFVAEALNKAGWKWKPERLPGPPALTTGISVLSTPDPESSGAAHALFEALNPIGRGGLAILGALPDADGPRVHLIVQERSGPYPEDILFR